MRRLCLGLVLLAITSSACAQDAPERSNSPTLVLDSGGHTAHVSKVLFTPGGQEVISVSYDKTIRVWDVDSGECLRVLRPPIGAGKIGDLTAAALSPDGKTLAVGG